MIVRDLIRTSKAFSNVIEDVRMVSPLACAVEKPVPGKR